MHAQGIVFGYCGYMTEEVLSGIGTALKQKLYLEKTDKQTAKGLFSIFVEQVQNVIRYSAEGEPEETESGEKKLRYGVLTVGREGESHFVACGNLVRKSDVERLSKSLKHIKNLDKEGLKALYKQTLKGDTPEGSLGAGVGFIDIARRAEQNFEFDFLDVDEDFSYFCLKAFM